MADPPVDAVGEWLASARKEVAVARLLLETGHIEAAAFHAQQAIEKALKAELVSKGVRPSKTHDLDQLARNLAPSEFPGALLTQATTWAITGRYVFSPEALPEEEDIRRALDAAGLYLVRLAAGRA